MIWYKDTAKKLLFENISGLRGDSIVVLGVEKRSVPKLQDERTVRKVSSV